MRKYSLLIALLVFLFASMNHSYATGFSDMSNEQKYDWIMQNTEEQVFEGIFVENAERSGSSGKILTARHTTIASHFYHTVGRLEGQCWWIADMNQNVTGHGTEVIRVIPDYGFVGHITDNSGYLVMPNNARRTLAGTLADWAGSHDVIQVYNLHGHGSYSYWEYPAQ